MDKIIKRKRSTGKTKPELDPGKPKRDVLKTPSGETAPNEFSAEERLQKIISKAGLMSRRGAERMILAGRVKVNGRVADQLGTKARPGRDRIEVDGQLVGAEQKPAYYLFYKPVGYITSLKDPQGRPSVTTFMKALDVRVFPVGRLDMDAEGALVLTNDGELARRLMHPKFHVPKIYRVKVKGLPTADTLKRLTSGTIMLGDMPAGEAEVKVVKRGTDRTWLHLTLYEGRHHQVKRMCSTIGHPVMKLKRLSFGPLTLGRLAPGEIRPLKTSEIEALKHAAGMI